MQHIKHAVISAAGLGSRLGMNMPKCLLSVYGRSLIEYQLELLRDVVDVRVVVGFKEIEVMRLLAGRYPNVTFVRNPDYAHTSNTHSLYLATKDLKEPFIAIDGDLLIEPKSFGLFLNKCRNAESSIVGISPKTTEDAIGVRLEGGSAGSRVLQFVRNTDPDYGRLEYEWCGVAFFNGMKVQTQKRFVFEEIARHLPVPSHLIDCAEVDTAADLERAREAAARYFPAR